METDFMALYNALLEQKQSLLRDLTTMEKSVQCATQSYLSAGPDQKSLLKRGISQEILAILRGIIDMNFIVHKTCDNLQMMSMGDLLINLSEGGDKDELSSSYEGKGDITSVGGPPPMKKLMRPNDRSPK